MKKRDLESLMNSNSGELNDVYPYLKNVCQLLTGSIDTNPDGNKNMIKNIIYPEKFVVREAILSFISINKSFTSSLRNLRIKTNI